MKLVTRLWLSFAAPIGLLSLAMTVMLVSQFRMMSLIGQIRDEELGTIAQEEALHDAAWAIEVAARRGAQLCSADAGQEPSVRADLEARGLTVERAMSTTPRRREALVKAVENYRAFAAKLSEPGACDYLLAETTKPVMLKLDDDLTEAWISRLRELHGSLTAKEEDTRKLGAKATAEGLAMALLACLFALLFSRSIARTITSPMAALAAAARRIGRGDFGEPVASRGPTEVVALGNELESMRQKLGELDSLKQGFIAQVSHELRTPLTKLREAISLLADGAGGPLTERQTRLVQIARSACEREIRMVSTLLDLSRLQAGSPLARQSGASLDAIVRAALEYERPDALARDVGVVLEVEGEVPPLSLDEALLERAIANLVRNAVSVSPAGEDVRVVRSIVGDDEAGPRVRVLVSDRGPGVPPEARAHLFRPFATHAVKGTSHRIGVGLGLALAREVARAHGGDVELVEGTEGGAAFALWLPLSADKPRPAKRESAP